MLSIAHPVIDGDGTSSLMHFSSGIFFSLTIVIFERFSTAN